jgi:hypothetical protein
MVIMILVVAILGRVTSSGKKQASQTAPPDKVSKIWILYFSIALIIALWTIWGALFLLTVVWILRRNPKPYSKEIPLPADTEKKTARLLYTWLMLSSFFTVPIFVLSLFNLSSYSVTNERVLAALIPLIFHTPLLLGLSSKRTFVFRHTQQAIFLMAVRVGVASLSVNLANDVFDGIWLFLLGNGALWLFGSIWGWGQIERGECWFMERKGETILAKGVSVPPPEINRETKLSPEKYIEYSKWFIKHERQDAAKEYALEAFRLGNLEIREQAVEVLYRLGGVEKF